MALQTLSIDFAQTFYVDPTVAENANEVGISAVDLFFKFKPDQNFSLHGIPSGVTLFITETVYGVPRITRESGIFTGNVARASYDQILTSSNATLPTKFRFQRPVHVDTDKEYAIVGIFENSEQFTLWSSIQGDRLIDTSSTAQTLASNIISPGPSGKYIGTYYDFNSLFVADDTTDLDDYIKNWRAISDEDLKFNVYIARFAHNGSPVFSNTTIDDGDKYPNQLTSSSTTDGTNVGFNVRFRSYELFSYNEELSTKQMFVGGQRLYQNTFSYPGGYENSGEFVTISTTQSSNVITANSAYPNGASFDWNGIYQSTTDAYIVLKDTSKVNVRRVTNIRTNTVLELDEPVTFSNTTAQFMITPIARVNSFNKESPFGVVEGIMDAVESSANSTVRFVNNVIESVSITSGGSGYSNSDVLFVTGFENVAGKVTGGYNAVANLVTDGSGVITNIYFSNNGCGFVNTSAIALTFANSTSLSNTTSNTSAGSSATLSFSVGATLKTEDTPNTFRKVKVTNIDLGNFVPMFDVNVPNDVDYQLKLESRYFRQDDASTLSGYSYYVNENSTDDQIQLVLYDNNNTDGLPRTPIVMSKSNEFNTLYTNGSANPHVDNFSHTEYSEQLVLVGNSQAQGDYSCFSLETSPTIAFFKYIINNDATNEHTDSGNAYAKHITKTIDFTRPAEDIRVFLTAYKPTGTDLKVYARIFNQEDPDAFDDKNWTELELKDGTDVISSRVDTNDYVELTYGFYQVPEDRTALNGRIQIQSACTEILGVDTTFDTDLAAGDLIYMYQPLFPNNHLVSVVNSVSTNTLLIIDSSTTNTSLIAEGMKIEKINKPNQAFNNKQNDNIVRYHNSTTTKFDKYETVAVKVVFLSDESHKIPRIDDLRVVGVSA